jgi:TolA-binding protein
LGLVCILASSSSNGQAPEQSTAQVESSPAALTAYADAANYQNKMAYALAAEEWQRFLERFPNDPLAAKALHYRGICQVQLKEYAEAVKSFEQVLAKYPQFELREETYLNLGWSLYSLALAGDRDRYAPAAETFGKLETEFAQGKYVDQALFFKAESLYALGQRKDAAMAYGKLVTSFPESKLRVDTLYALGVTLEELSQWEQAAKAYDMFLEDYASNELATEVRMRRAETMLQRGDAQAAEPIFAEVAAMAGFAAADHALMRQAYAAAQQDKNAEAAGLYATVVERFPQSPSVPEATLSAARCYYRAGQMDKAVEWLDRVLAAQGKGMIEAAHWRCRIYLQSQQVEQALQLAEEKLAAAGEDPFGPHLQLDRADALYAIAGREAEALQAYLDLAEAHPAHEVGPIALYNAAFTALELKQYDQAITLAGRFLAEQPDHLLTPDVRYVVAECKVQTNELGEAESIYRQVLSSAAEHRDRHHWQIRLGWVLYLQQKYAEVLELLGEAASQLQTPALKAEALYLVGVSQYQLGQCDAAAASLRSALLADANWRQVDETLLFLARSQGRLNQIAEAIATLQQLIENYPHSKVLDQAYYHLGEYHFAAGRFDDAVAAYDQVLLPQPPSAYVPFALYGKGWARMKAGQFQEAIQTLTQLIDQHADHAVRRDGLLARGMCYRQAENHTAAIADLDQYLSVGGESPQRADALYERGLCEALAQQYDKAVKTFQELLEQYPQYSHADKVRYELAWACKSLPDEAAAAAAFAELAEKHADSPLAAEALFHVGEAAYGAKQYAEAAQAYQGAAKADHSALHEKALYKLGWSQYQLQQYAEALAQFDAMLQTHAEGELVADAWFMKAECLFKMQDYQQALPAYRAALARAASSPQVAVIRLLHAAQAAGQLEQWQDSVTFLNTLIDEHPDSYYLGEAHFERAQAKLKLQQAEEAIADYQVAAEKSRDVVGTRALFMIGEVQFQQKRYEDAIRNFQRAMFRNSGSEELTAPLRPWQAQAGYEAGRCCEVQIADAPSATLRDKYLADAKKFYQYVVESHADHELAAEAQKRLAALAQLVP